MGDERTAAWNSAISMVDKSWLQEVIKPSGFLHFSPFNHPKLKEVQVLSKMGSKAGDSF